MVQSQNWTTSNKSEVKKAINTAIQWAENQDKLNVQIQYISYKDHASNEVKDKENGYYSKSGKDYMSKALGIKTIAKGLYKLAIDTAEETIAISNRRKNDSKIINENIFDNLMDMALSIKKKNEANLTKYRIEGNADFDIQNVEIEIDSKGSLNKIIYYYAILERKIPSENPNKEDTIENFQPRMEMHFKNYDIAYIPSEKDFRDDNIVWENNSKLILVNEYKNYKINDLRNSKK
jgi:hypothetical protein